MTVETRDAEFRRPDAVALLRSLTDEEAAKHPPPVREHDDVAAHYWREGDRVCRREVASTLLCRDFRTCGMDDESAVGN